MNEVASFRDFYKFLFIVISVLALSACQLTGPKKEAQPVAMEPEPIEEAIPPPTDSLTPNQRVRKALQHLQQGDYENARNQLNWALMDDPDHSRANHLLEQMDADPIEYLGLKNFFYDVQPGDSLSLIAKNFLNDAYKFVILARYNKLDNPSKLAPGQRIRVPGVMPERVKIKAKPKQKPEVVLTEEPTKSLVETDASTDPETATSQLDEPTPTTTVEPVTDVEPASETVVVVEPEADLKQPEETATTVVDRTPSSDDTLSSARQLHAEKDLPAAIYLLESENSRNPEAAEIRSQLASYYTEYANQLIRQDDLENARDTLEKLIILDASDSSAINQLIYVEDKIEARKLLQKAANEERGGEYQTAYRTYGQVLTYDPDNLSAQESQVRVRNQLTDNYHRQAMQLFRRQELDEAIGFWNKILELDPNHSLAPGYKARALEMKQQIQRIDSKPN
ncbi:MAG: LysM peptidoglycan-binding domain-containing protein [Candidatus Thiodiazotropha lotti]|nr:LysM peptidoglycan-binding domain-containing protein [Candidatus Thiodiazotropha lotti]MCW4191122.1 LysM peptidoglycan-binding domain-containing protein [Candidatus Thiodiazotropha weberae]